MPTSKINKKAFLSTNPSAKFILSDTEGIGTGRTNEHEKRKF